MKSNARTMPESGDLRNDIEDRIEPARWLECARCAQRIPAGELPDFHAAEVHGRPMACLGAQFLAAVHLDSADFHHDVARQHL
jgi:hypothetical protein